jgi:hypothetical protein
MDGHGPGLRGMEQQFQKYVRLPENMFTEATVLFFCGHHVGMVLTVMKAACTTVGARVVELVLCWLSAGQLGV